MLSWYARRAVLAVGIVAIGLAACAEPSPSGVVVAPIATASSATPSNVMGPLTDAAGAAGAVARDPIPMAPTSPPVDGDDGGAPSRLRACRVDADCVAVPRVGCCHNGWNEAVAAAQKSAYKASFVCPDPHPICAMFIVRDTRQPRCDAAAHLCTLVSP